MYQRNLLDQPMLSHRSGTHKLQILKVPDLT
jgi:hypothetical protein